MLALSLKLYLIFNFTYKAYTEVITRNHSINSYLLTISLNVIFKPYILTLFLTLSLLDKN
jgi:hypothetical protein